MNPETYLLVGRPAPVNTDEGIWKAIYADAARETNRTEEQLRAMAVQVFATILHHMINERNVTIWTAARLESSGRFSVEVNILPRFRTKGVPVAG